MIYLEQGRARELRRNENAKNTNVWPGQAFKQCDVDNSGRIDVKELHIGLLILYDKLNGMLPIHYPIPSKAEVRRCST